MLNAEYARRFTTPATDLAPQDAREELSEITRRLSAGWGRADEHLYPTDPLFGRYQDRRTALRRALGQLHWQQRQETFCRVNSAPVAAHRRIVERALREGETVPADVLADYPDLGPVPYH